MAWHGFLQAKGMLTIDADTIGTHEASVRR
ncbi:hypothetical protein EDE04_7379 [Streptomyces sp. 2132.2]|nr:hypothetical protein EDE04_7379 [Streptomyces sp. 2132.2]